MGGQGTPENASFTVQVNDASTLPQVETIVRQTMANVPGFVFATAGFGGGGTGVNGRAIVMNLQTIGSTNDLLAASDQIMAAIKDVPGLVDIGRSYQPGKPELHINVDGDRAAQLGLNTAAVGSTVRTLVNGSTASRYQDPGREADILVRLRPDDRSRFQDILSLSLTTATGQSVPLSSVASFTNASGPTALERLDREPKITIGANILERAQQPVVNDIQARLDKLKAARRRDGRVWRRGPAVQRFVLGADRVAAAVGRPGLHGIGVPIRFVHAAPRDDARAAAVAARRIPGADHHAHCVRPDGDDRHHHAVRTRHQELDPAGRLCQSTSSRAACRAIKRCSPRVRSVSGRC